MERLLFLRVKEWIKFVLNVWVCRNVEFIFSKRQYQALRISHHYSIMLITVLYLVIFHPLIYAQNPKSQTTKSKTNPIKIQKSSNTQKNKEYPTFPSEKSSLLDSLFKTLSPEYQKILQNPEKYRFQLIYTQIDRNSKNIPKLTHHIYRLDTTEYFYPASCLKMPVAVLALEKLKNLKIPNLNWDTQIVNEKSRDCQMDPITKDPDMESGIPTIKGYIKKIFLISDNPGYDRLYEFLTPYYINDTLRARGYKSTRIIQRLFTYCKIEEHKYINPIKFYHNDSVIYQQPAIVCDSTYELPHLKKEKVGKFSWNGYTAIQGGLEPHKYSYISLKDLHEMLIAIMMPNSLPKLKRFKLKQAEYDFLRKYMSMYPSESKDPDLNKKQFSYYENGRMKYFIYGGQGKDTIPNIRIFNKVGMAIGFLTDVAYIVDFEKKCEFFLSATVYVNENQIIGDDKYEYYTLGLPFLKEIGLKILEYERKRPKNYPDLSKYRYDYSRP